jgi:hypothetical protein
LSTVTSSEVSAWPTSVSLSVALLLPGFGSVAVLETVAVLTSEPVLDEAI